MPDVFILSSPRSGSTVTRLTLGKLENLVTLPETHFWVFKNRYKSYSLAKDIAFIADKWIHFYSIKKYPVNHLELKQDIISNAKKWNDLLEITAKHYLAFKYNKNVPDNLIICEKSPPHIFHIRQILKEYPQAKYIFLIRDPRDVVASLKNCSWSTSNPLINALVWKNGIKRMWTGDNAIIIKYEDLVTNPAAVLKNICQFLNITFDDKIIIKETTDIVEMNNPTSVNSLKPISDKFITSYKNKLSAPDREQEIIEKICIKEMLKYNYTIEKYKKTDFNLLLKIMYYRLGLLLSKISK